MMSHQIHLAKEESKSSDYVSQSPESDNDDLLDNVDQFIESVYRDLSISPPHRSSTMENPINSSSLDISTSSSTTSPENPATLPVTAPRREKATTSSPLSRRNMDAEIERINRICDNVDQNLRSIGLLIDSSAPGRLSNTNLINSPPSSTSIIIVNSSSPSLSSVVHRTKPQRRASVETAVESVIDLSNSQAETPDMFRRPVKPDNGDDDDVILVSANLPHVVDLCTPNFHQDLSIYRPRHTINSGHISRRRLHQNSVDGDADSTYGSSSPRKRRTETSFTSSETNCLLVDDTASASKDEGRTPFMCPVCMESCLQRQPTSTVCGHVFCKLCIDRAMALTRKCPMCNKKISKAQTFRIYF